MEAKVVIQPSNQLGIEITNLLTTSDSFTKIALVSAFVSRRMLLRLRDHLLHHLSNGSELWITAGIDLDGTSREALEELLEWNCSTYIYQNPYPRSTFHPKAYLFEQVNAASAFIGSNNLTDGGFYTNFEAATRFDFAFPADETTYRDFLEPLTPFFFPQIGANVQRLDDRLIQTLVARGTLPTEREARSRKGLQQSGRGQPTGGVVPPNPFIGVGVPLPPLLPESQRTRDLATTTVSQSIAATGTTSPIQINYQPDGTLVWQKKLTNSDALQTKVNSAHVGGIRLTQAKFNNPPGHCIDQTTYFRRLFANYDWQPETGRHRSSDQEHTYIPMRLIIRDKDYGINIFEISHKPSGEARQGNYTTILRWGRHFNSIIKNEQVANTTLSLYETNDQNAHFNIVIT